MNCYIILGIKIFIGIILFFQMIFVSYSTISGYIEEDKFAKIRGIIVLVLFSITIPIACWIFNL